MQLANVVDLVGMGALLLIIVIFALGRGLHMAELWCASRYEFLLILVLPTIRRLALALSAERLAGNLHDAQTVVLLICASRFLWSAGQAARKWRTS